jgi:hypothetical protein
MEAADEGTGGGGGGGGGGGDAFDPAKFRTDLLAEFNKGLNGALKNLKAELTKKPETEPEPEPEPEPKPGEKTDSKVKALEKKLADALTKFENSEKARMETESRAKTEKLSGALRTELLKFVPPERIDAALRIFSPDVKYSEEGNIVGGSDDTPLKDFVEATIKQHEYLLPPKAVGGAGATAGGRRAAPVDLNDIKPGMKPEELERVRGELHRIAQESGFGQ